MLKHVQIRHRSPPTFHRNNDYSRLTLCAAYHNPLNFHPYQGSKAVMSHSPTFDSSSPTPPPPARYKAPEFLPAIHIRSRPLPSNFHPPEDPSDSHRPVDVPPQHPSDVWKEWYLSSTKHGPERVKGPPVFVLAKGDYDDLGRSTLDGVGVDVEDGGGRKRRKLEAGETVAEWYTALSGSGASTPRPEGPSRPAVRVGKEDAIDMTLESDDEDVKPIIGGSSQPGSSMRSEMRVNPDEWFIRRALLKRHNQSIDPPTRVSRTIPIGSLLGVTPIQQVKSAPKYTLGPENKGYDILKNTLGWGGGGLGKPDGWQPRTAGPSTASGPSTSLNLAQELELDNFAEAARRSTPVVPVEENGVIDFTAETDEDDDESAPEDLSDFDDTPDGPSGPGRIVPIATTLKLDRLGLGHRRTNFDAKGNPLKRVTHTHKEIEEAQRRAKRPVERRNADLGEKAKIKWKLKDKRETDERRRIAAALNA